MDESGTEARAVFRDGDREGRLVAPAIQLAAPLLKRLRAQLIGQVDHGNRPLRREHGDLLVDERVVEAGGGGFLVGRREEHA